jgi:hypothetical protein
MLGMYDAHIASGRHYAIQTRWLAELTPPIIGDIIAAAAAWWLSKPAGTC